MSIEEIACIINGRCGLEKSPEQIREDVETLRFRKENPDLSVLSQKAMRPLIREKDPETRDKVIESVKNLVKSPKDPETGKMKKKVQYILWG